MHRAAAHYASEHFVSNPSPIVLPAPLELGRVLFALGLAGLGAQNVLLGGFLNELQPVPDWLPGHLAWAELTGLFLIVAGAGLIAGRRVRLVATVIGLVLSAWVLLLHAPKVVLDPRNGGAWTSGFEIFALAGAAAILAASAPPERLFGERWNRTIAALATPGRVCFAISLPVFGVLHFIYYRYVASVIPGWIPAPVFWAYFTGVAHAAAGLGIVTGVLARLAATLLGLMFGTWVLILHVPRVIADPGNRREWTSLFVATALCGGAWLVASSLAKFRVPQRETPAPDRTRNRESGAGSLGHEGASIRSGGSTGARADRLERRIVRDLDERRRLLAERVARLADPPGLYGSTAAVACLPPKNLAFAELIERLGSAADIAQRLLRPTAANARSTARSQVTPRHAQVCVDPAVLRRYVGRYEVPGEGIFELALAHDALMIQAPPGWQLPRLPLRAESSVDFSAEPALRLTIQIDDEGRVLGLLIFPSRGPGAVPAHRCAR